jgi:hypothetical protein
MSIKANISSIEALATFRGQLITSLEKLLGAVDDASDDVSRIRMWLQQEKRLFWENELKRRAKVLEMAQQELFSSRISNLEPSTLDRQMAVRKAKSAMDEAMMKLQVLKKWNRVFDSEVEPLGRQLDKVRGVLSGDMVKAVAFLTEAIKTLDEYMRLSVQDAGAAKAASSVAPSKEQAP